MGKKDSTDPTLVALSGSDGFHRRRALKRTIKDQEKSGWRISWADATDPMSIWEAAAADIMFEAPVLVIVKNPEKGKLDLYREFMKREEGTSVILLYVEGKPRGNTKFGKFLKEEVKAHQSYELSTKPWELEKAAVEFTILEAKNTFGKKLSLPLAEGIVNRVGSGYGILHFELLKMATLAEEEGATEITTAHAKAALAPLVEASVTPLLEALSKRSAVRLARALDRIKKTSNGDPTIGISRLLAMSVYKWLGPLTMKERGLGATEAAMGLGQNEWYYKTKLLPQVARWTTPEVISLIQKLGESERSVLMGHLNPWLALVSRLLTFCPTKAVGVGQSSET